MIPINVKIDESAKDAIRDGAKIGGFFTIEVFDNAKDMNLISKSVQHNIVPNETLDHILDVIFHGVSAVDPWYCSIFESDSTPLATWTYDLLYDSQATEWQSYDEATRPTYVEAAASGQSITNSANKAVFTANATKTLYGAALVSVNTKGDHGAGTIGPAGRFAASQPVISGNVVNLTYTISAADDGV